MIEQVPELSIVAEGFSFLEGPRWRDGALYVSDFFTKRVLRVRGRAVEEVCFIEHQPSGLGWDVDGNLLIVSMLDKSLLRFDGQRLELIADLSEFATGPCNDMLVDSVGRAYVGNFGGDGEADSELRDDTVLVRVDPDASTQVVASDLRFPNGIALSPDGLLLLVAETYAARISAFDVASDGSLSGRRPWADFSRGSLAKTAREMLACRAVLPDGICLDAEGALWVADAAGSGVVRVREGGEIVECIPTGDLTVFSVVLGGDDGRRLFLCASPGLFETDYRRHYRSSLLSCSVRVPA